MITHYSLKIVVVSILFGAFSGAVTATVILKTYTPSQDELIREFYRVEVASNVSPHHLRKAMTKGETDDFVLVDLRSPEEYEREHIAGAISIWAYNDPENSAYDEVDRIVSMFRALPQDKDIIVYCYSIPCMTGRKIGHALAEHGVYVKLLGVGWNEWRYFWTLWNHEHEWDQINVEDYIASGSEPGSAKADPNYISPCLEGQFDC
jgi:rhodanese-related sulfurtransferase